MFRSTKSFGVSALNRLEDISIGSAVTLDGQRIVRQARACGVQDAVAGHGPHHVAVKSTRINQNL